MSYYKKSIKFLNWFLFRIIIVALFWGLWRVLPIEEQQTYYKKIFRYVSPEPIILCDKNIKLKEKQYVLIPFGMNQEADLTVDYKILTGEKINVIFMAQSDYLMWERGLVSDIDAKKKIVVKQRNMKDINYLRALSTFESYSSKKKARLRAGTYDMVLDNTGNNSSNAELNLKIIINN